MVFISSHDTELLQFLQENGNIDLPSIEEAYNMFKDKKYLDMHPYTIWQGKNSKWYTYLPNEKMADNRRLMCRNSKTDIQKVVVDYWKDKESNPSLKEIFNEWNDRRLSLDKISKSTHYRYAEDFKKYFSNGFDNKHIRSVSVEEFVDFLEESLANYNLTSKAFVNLKTITKGIVKQAKRKGYIDFTADRMIEELDVSDKSFKRVIKEDYQEVFNDIETEKYMKYLIDNQDLKNLGILLMFVTGLRIGEVVALKKEDFKNGIVSIRRTETCIHKDNGGCSYEIKDFPKTAAGVRDVVLPNEFLWLSDKLVDLGGEEYIFMDGSKRMNTHYLRRRVYRICDKLKIYKKSPHKIRKTYGTILLDNDTDKNLIKGQMGHTSISITENYYHRNRKNIEKKQKIISEIPDFAIYG